MNLIRFYFSRYYWKCHFSVKKVALSIFSMLGVFVSSTEIVQVFHPPFVPILKGQIWYFIACGIFWSFWQTKAKLSITHRLNNRDIAIQIVVADMFKIKGDYVVGTNTTFDTALERRFISERSVQGQFTLKFYKRNLAELNSDLEQALKDQKHEIDPSRQQGKNKKYPLGTVVKIQSRDGKTGYFVAIAEINDYGNTTANFEGLKVSLAKLWDFIIDRGDMEPLIIPILGSGFSRINQKREEIVCEILNSFIAACSAKKFCEKLILAISPKDLTGCEINLDNLDKYLEHLCKYTVYQSKETQGIGVGLGSSQNAS